MATIRSTELIDQIHAAPTRMVLAVSGGGSHALAELLAVPGASRTVLEAVVPYSAPALVDWLGGQPDQFCSEVTARAMAMAAWMRALRLAPAAAETLAGIGATASLASTRPKRGPHRVHVALQTACLTESWSLPLAKGARSRADEERVCADLVLMAAGQAARVSCPLDGSTLPGEQIHGRRRQAVPEWTDLLLGRRDRVGVGIGDADTAAPVRAVFPGAFHPLHDGHRAMARLAARLLGTPVAFELSIANVDKPPLDFIEIASRLESLAGQPVWLTRAATFHAKSALFPGTTFVVGADTIQRIADPRYYGNNRRAMAAAIDAIRERGCRFLVFGRLVAGTFRTLSDLPLPASLREVCRQVSADDFHDDRSSTAIRRTTIR